MEVFVLGVLFSILHFFLLNYFRAKKTRDLTMFFVFLNFFIFMVATLFSQFLIKYHNTGHGLALAQRMILVSLLLGGFFLLLFINSRSKIRGDKGVVFFLFLVFSVLLGMMSVSPITVFVRQEAALEPNVVVHYLNFPFLPLEIVRLFWFSLWGLLGLISFINIFPLPREKAGQKILYFYVALSCLLFVIAYVLMQMYIKEASAPAFLFSWVFILLGSVGVALGEGIDPESDLALNPLNYFRTRLLFKVLFGFVFLIILLFGTTYLLTVKNIDSAFMKNKLSGYGRVSFDVARDIARLDKPDPDKIYKIISNVDFGPESSIFVVGPNGRLLAKSPVLKLKFNEDLSGIFPVKEILSGKTGGREFYDKDGSLMLGFYRPIKTLRMGLVAQQPAYWAYRDVDKMETDLLLYVIAGIIITILIGFVFSSALEGPLKRLERGTQAIASGDLSYRIGEGSIDELGKLAQAYNKMTAELRETQNRLIISEKMIALGNMAAGMAHEIRNPLVSLRTFTQLLGQRWEDPDFRSKFSAIVPREIERINRIAESLLKFGRPWQADVKETKISSVLEEVLLLFEPEMKKKNIALQTKFADVPSFQGDAPQLVQAFTNIVKNAIEAMGEKGGGELYIETEYIMALKLKKQHFSPNEMTWGHKIEEKPYIMVKVIDNGGGVREGRLRNLFDPFYTSKVYGTGMGLPITLRIIEEHHGAIKVKNRPDEGTTFVVYLPQERQA